MSFLILIFLVIFPISSYSSITTEDCLGCHDKYIQFNHGKASCPQCHIDINSLPHDEKLKKPSCNACHQKTSKEYEDSIHTEKKLFCKDCHNAHFIKEDKRGCLDCHKDIRHASLPSKEKHLKAMDCLACHSKSTKDQVLINIDIGKKNLIKNELIDIDRDGFLNRGEFDNLQSMLQQKYEGKYQIKKQYAVSASPHTVMKKPVTCNACHNEKGLFQHVKVTITGKSSYVFSADPKIFIPELPSIEKYKLTVHGKKGIECFNCHTSQERVSDSTCIACHKELYGIYKGTVHSKEGAAQCIDCHNPHKLQSYKEMGAQERLAVCSRCHKDYINKHRWLPNTVLHFNYLECSTCHSPDSAKGMVFNFAFREGGKIIPLTYDHLEKIFGTDINVKKFIDRNNDGIILSQELADFFIDLRLRSQKDVVISSSIVVTKVHHNYSEKNTKSRVCSACHSEEAPFYESMFVSIPEKGKTASIPVKGSVLSAFPTSAFIDMFLLGEGKIRAKDFNNILKASRAERVQIVSELGYKLIDFIGITISVLILCGIAVHILLRVVVKK
jgi:predicted CXXCH cytochrome family protein